MNNPKNNRILSALSDRDYQSLRDRLESVELTLGEILLEANHKIEWLYFPTQGIVSLVSSMQNGSTTEIGLIGKEGIVGIPQFLGNGVCNSRIIVQGKGSAMRIKKEMLRVEFDRSKTIQELLLCYSLKLFNQVSQCSACNNHHTVKQRTARWLLMLDDRSYEKPFLMTQQLLSQMLGVRRTGITEIAKEIQQQGIIDYHRGKITVLQREALETIACECYQILKD